MKKYIFKMKNGKIFVKITNEDIYKEIQELKEKNAEAHNAILKEIIETNGKVKFHSKIIWFIIGAIGTIISWIFYILKGIK